MTYTSRQLDQSQWPYRLALIMEGTTLPLIFVGGLVTTTQAGMAVPDWPTTYGYNMFLYPWQTWLFGPWDLFVEHGHRLLASLVGMFTIAFLIACFRCDSRRWIHGLSVVALIGVVAQGVLGGMRVLLDERTLAQIHACVGPAFFAFTTALAVFCSPRWRAVQPRAEHPDAAKLHRLTLITTVLAYVQLVLGSELRHIGVAAEPGVFQAALVFHLLLAAILLLHVILVFLQVHRHFGDERALVRPARWLAGLTVLQIALGAGTWIVKFGWPAFASEYFVAASYLVEAQSFLQSLTVTAHVAIGSLILAMSLTLALRGLGLFAGQPRWSPLDAKDASGASLGDRPRRWGVSV